MPQPFPLAEIRVPPTVWLDADAEPVEAATADKAAAEHEARQGVSFEIDAETLASLAVYPAAALLWVAFKRIHAARFRKARELALNGAPAIVLGADDSGGFLVWLTATEDEAMTNVEQARADYGAALEKWQESYVPISALVDAGQTGSAAHKTAIDAMRQATLERDNVARAYVWEEYPPETMDNQQSTYEGVLDRAEKIGASPSIQQGIYDEVALGLSRDELSKLRISETHDMVHGPDPDNEPTNDGPQRTPDPTPPKDGGRETTLDERMSDYLMERRQARADAEKAAFVLIERSASGNQETGMTAYLYTDRDAAGESAKGFPMSQEDAARQGQTTWAEVHPVTGYFAENFETMQEAGRLDNMAALYSTVREIDGHLAPAHPAEPGAITGQLREIDAADASPYPEEPTRPQHMRAAITSRPTPGGTETTANAFFHPNENPAAKAVQEAINENRQTLDPMADRGANHYAVLQAETQKAAPREGKDWAYHPEHFAAWAEASPYNVTEGDYIEHAENERRADMLAIIAESRDVDGGAPNLREIVTRQAEESTARQGAELDASQGVATADRPMTADERFAARMEKVEAELTKREEREGIEPVQERGESRAAGGPGMF
jgi:hypothetical protein